MMDYETQQEALAVLAEARDYVQAAHDVAQARHETSLGTYGDDWMSDALWKTVQKTEALLARMDALQGEEGCAVIRYNEICITTEGSAERPMPARVEYVFDGRPMMTQATPAAFATGDVLHLMVRGTIFRPE